ncbi:hypothetical protein H0E37_002346 [Salmonella enterica subsp. enterica serovar Give]|nr:hypothetical protein [Salmonella enterica subsp. enterica serovar Give]
MSNHKININIKTNTNNLEEVNEGLTRLKFIIGVLLAKFPPLQRDEFIKDLGRFGLTEEAALYSNFNPKPE